MRHRGSVSGVRDLPARDRRFESMAGLNCVLCRFRPDRFAFEEPAV